MKIKHNEIFICKNNFVDVPKALNFQPLATIYGKWKQRKIFNEPCRFHQNFIYNEFKLNTKNEMETRKHYY